MEGILWASAAATLPLALFCLMIWRLWPHSVGNILGVYRKDDQLDEKVRQAVIVEVKKLDLKNIPRKKAQKLVEAIAKAAIAKTFSDTYAREYDPDTFDAFCIVTGNIAVIDIDLGIDYAADQEGVTPVNVEVHRQAMILDARPKIRRAIHGEEIPNGRPDVKRKAR